MIGALAVDGWAVIFGTTTKRDKAPPCCIKCKRKDDEEGKTGRNNGKERRIGKEGRGRERKAGK